MSTIIFYGAGENARTKMSHWREKGLNPVCFVDADVRKHHTLFEGVEILPLLEALGKYPDYEIYCTQIVNNLFSVQQYLLGIGIPENRIHFCEDVDRKYLPRPVGTIYPTFRNVYRALQDDLSKLLFWGRVNYTVSFTQSGIFQSMLTDEHQKWLETKRIPVKETYGFPVLWELLEENFPVQKHKIYLIVFETWNEYNWEVERFLQTIPKLGIKVSGCIMPDADNDITEFQGIIRINEEEFWANTDENVRVILGYPTWSSHFEDVAKRYLPYKNIVYPLADLVEKQYIEPDIFIPREDEIFVDVGVYDLQNSIDFADWAVKGWKKIYAFEPDAKCYRQSKQRLEEMDETFRDKCKLVNKGLSAVNRVLEFPEEYNFSEGCTTTVLVEVVSLDSYLDGEPVTFIKMDVEGAEMDVLLGMRETIMRYKPKLAICVYHQHEDIYNIPAYIQSLVPEYKFWLRHYSSNEVDTVLLCTI